MVFVYLAALIIIPFLVYVAPLAMGGLEGVLIWTREATPLVWLVGNVVIVLALSLFAILFDLRTPTSDTGMRGMESRHNILSSIALVLLPVSTARQIMNRRNHPGRPSESSSLSHPGSREPDCRDE
jgi:hypothetical protein